MSRSAFTRAMDSMPAFRTLITAYVQAFLEQVMVSAACNGAHSLKERLARWLLMMHDRHDYDALPVNARKYLERLAALVDVPIGMISTGFMLFSADASKVADNAAFQVKMALIAAALANVAIYEFGARHAVEALAPGDAVPLRARIAGALSIMMWVMVAACGRAIAYL